MFLRPLPPFSLNGCSFESHEESSKLKDYTLLNDVFSILHHLGHMAQPSLNCKSRAVYALVLVTMLDWWKLRFPQQTQLKACYGASVLAKLYDPMYIDHDDFCVNPFLVADMNYATETATHKALSNFQGSTIPQYYGSYFPEVPVDPSTKRSVRLILIELSPGSSMQDIDPCAFSQEAHQKIIKSVIKLESSIHAQGVILDDLHPRNVMLTDPADEETRIDFIDFGDAGFPGEGYEYPGSYISPLLRWHEAQWKHSPFENWIDWDWQFWIEAEFADTAATILRE